VVFDLKISRPEKFLCRESTTAIKERDIMGIRNVGNDANMPGRDWEQVSPSAAKEGVKDSLPTTVESAANVVMPPPASAAEALRARNSLESSFMQQRLAGMLGAQNRTTLAVNDPVVAKERLGSLGLAGSTLRQITDSAAVRLARLNDNLLRETGQLGADKEGAFARKIDGLSADDFEKLAGLPAADQTRISKLSSQQMVEALQQISPPPSDNSNNTTTVAAAKDKLTKLGLAGSTVRQLTDSAAIKLARMDEGVIRDVGVMAADKERAFASKIDGLPSATFDKLVTLSGSEQARISKLSSNQIIDEVGKVSDPPVNPAVATARQKLTGLGFDANTVRQLSDSANLRLAALSPEVISEVGRGDAAGELAFGRKIDALPLATFDKLRSLNTTEQSRISKLDGQAIVEEVKKLDQPGANPQLAAAVFNAVDVVLGRKPATTAEKAAATEIIKQNLSVNEFRNARSKRNDPVLLNDRYPKGTELKVGANKDQKVYWTQYDRLHFAARHLINNFDTADIKAKNGWWPAGTTQEQIDKYLQMTLEANASKITLPAAGSTGPGFRYFDFDLPDNSGIKVQVGLTSEGRVTSFFAVSGPNVTSVSGDDVKKLLMAAGK
jgi:hypothetical protein